MKQIKEFITFDKGFFSTMKQNHRAIYDELFSDNGEGWNVIDPKNLDMDLLVTCGERYAAPLLIHYDMAKVVEYVLNRYTDSWKRCKAALMADYDVLKPYDTVKTTTQEKTGENTVNNTVTDKTGVNTFDSEEPVDKQTDTTENSGKTTETETVKTTVENTGVTGNIPAANLIQSELEVRKTNFISLVIGDVETQLSLDIY